MSAATCRRVDTIMRHLTSTTTTTTSISITTIAHRFSTSPAAAWNDFCALTTWRERSAVVVLLKQNEQGWQHYLNYYRQKMSAFILPEFYDILDTPSSIALWQQRYASTGEINVPLLRPTSLHKLSTYCDSVESKGKRRYGQPRPSYPPGEWINYDANDPRKHIMTDVNMTAVASRHLSGADDDILWIYHSPHVQLFIEKTLECKSLHPYLSDLGIAVNIMRPRSNTQTALGFHFDSVDSSTQQRNTHTTGSGSSHSSMKIEQQKGVTGVIGLLDATEGGERIVFQNVHRNDVADVAKVVQLFNPLQPSAVITKNAIPKVETEKTAGMLYLFDGGNVLHGVSSVRTGSRIALAFLYSEIPPNETKVSEASADFFYKN